MADMLWVCHVIVDVFSQHGCLLIKSLSKFVRTLVFSVLVQSMRGESSRPCASAPTCTRAQNEGTVSSEGERCITNNNATGPLNWNKCKNQD